MQGGFSPELDSDLKVLQTMLLLGAKEASDVRNEEAAKLYKALLKEEVTSKRWVPQGVR